MAPPPLSDDEQRLASNAVRDLRVALSNFFLYAPENTMVQQSVDRFLQDVQGILATRPQVTLGESEGQLILEGSPVDTRHTGSTAAITDLFLQHQLHSLTFLAGVEREELVQLLQLLRPKALAAGETLYVALKRVSMPHVRVNQKVFVAVKEGEKLIATGDLGGEEDIGQAMESLKAFLGVFSQVKTDHKRREILGALQSQVGSLVPGAGGPGPGGGGGPGEDGVGAGAGWGEVVAGLMSLKRMLSGVEVHRDPHAATESVDVLLSKISALLGGEAGIGVLSALSAANEEAQGQESLFTKPSVLEEWRRGDFASLADADREADVEAALRDLGGKPDPALTDTLWKRLWVATSDAPREGTCLLFRHISRIPWEGLSPERRGEAPGLLRRMMGSAAAGENAEGFLACAGKWLEQGGDAWALTEFAELVATASRLAADANPMMRPNAELAARWLTATLTPERLQRFLEAALRDDASVEPAARILSAAPPGAGLPALEKALSLPENDPARNRAVDLVYRLQAEGRELLEQWLARQAESADLDAFLGVLEKVPLPPSLAPALESRWGRFAPEAKRRVIDLAVKWECRPLRPLILGALLEDIETARHALKALPRLHMEGDSVRVVEAVEKRSHAGKEEKEEFTLLVCKALEEMVDPMSITPLLEWTQTHGLLERHRDKSPAVRLAAVSALGAFRSRMVAGHLEKMVQKEEKEMKAAAEASLKRVKDRLAAAASAAESFIPPSPEIPAIEPPPAAPALEAPAGPDTLGDLFREKGG